VSIHLDYDEPVLGYHEVVADLAADRARPAGTVLDLGCGPGQLLGELARRRSDLRLVGVDGDGECLRRARVRCPEAELVEADLEHPAADTILPGSVDVIVSSHALEHLADPVAVLQRWSSLVGPGGCLVIAVPNALQPIMMARALVRRPRANEGHYYIWDRATFENFCRLAGFRVTGSALDYVPLVPVRIRRRLPPVAAIERVLLRPLPQFSNSHIVVLQRDG
jgi:SAM-dependent methyltransferase